MDVARELRGNRDIAEEMFRRDEVRVKLREKLMRSARLAGDRVTEAEVDAAIDQYLATLNTFADPKPGLHTTFAHLWVWRKKILTGVATVAITLGGCYYLFFSSSAPLSPAVRADRAVAAEQATASALLTRVEAITNDPAIIAQAKSLQSEANTATGEDVTTAIAARTKLAEMVDQLSTSYEVRIIDDPNQVSAIERGMDGKNPVYYVIVQARDASGNVVPQQIRNSETGRTERVTQWAEQVPRETYMRLRQDKTSDGLLSETLFSIKTRGSLEPAIRIPGATSAPIGQGTQLTTY